jgi:hypothetical protein
MGLNQLGDPTPTAPNARNLLADERADIERRCHRWTVRGAASLEDS